MQNSPDIKNTIIQDVTGSPKKWGNTKILSKTTIASPSKMRNNIRDHSRDKELINTGLHRLVTSFTSAQRCSRRASKLALVKKNNDKLEPIVLTTVPEKNIQSHIVLNKQMSIDKYTMTEFEDKAKELNIEATVLGEPAYRDLQWTDPRLLKKYSMVKQQKSLTVPLVDKSENNTEIVEKMSEVEELIPLRADETNFVFRILYYLCTSSVSFVGSMCGITLITLVLWKALDGNFFNFQFQTPKSETFLKRMLIRGPLTLLHLIDRIFDAFLKLLTISSTEVYAPEEITPLSWFHKFY